MNRKDGEVMQRKTYAKIDGEALTKNVREIRRKYPMYTYYFGVVKNNAYHHGMKCVLDLKKGGINYFAVSSLEEALLLRKYDSETPVLCLEPIDLEFIDDIINNNVTITVESLDYTEKLLESTLYGSIKVHLKVDSGMHRLGFTNKEDLKKAYDLLNQQNKIEIEGIYSHFATSGVVDPYYDEQVASFLDITSLIDLKSIPIVHLGRSLSLVQHEKIPFCNGIRLGIILYGFAQSIKPDRSFKGRLREVKRGYLQKKYHCSKTTLENDLDLQTAFSLYTEVMSVRRVSENDTVGYTKKRIKNDGYILTLPVGYADGVTSDFKNVWIGNNYYPIIADSMDMLMVFASEPVHVGTTVEIIGKHLPIHLVCSRTHKNAYHLLNDISNRVVRVHVKDKEQEEIYY